MNRNVMSLRRMVLDIISNYANIDGAVPSTEFINLTTEISRMIREKGFAPDAVEDNFDQYVKVLIIKNTDTNGTLIVKISKNPVIDGFNNDTNYVKIEDAYKYYLEIPIEIEYIKSFTKSPDKESDITEEPIEEIVNTSEECSPIVDNPNFALTKEDYIKIQNNLFYAASKLNKFILDLNVIGCNEQFKVIWGLDIDLVVSKLNEIEKYMTDYDCKLIIVFDLRLDGEVAKVNYELKFDHKDFGSIYYTSNYNNQF